MDNGNGMSAHLSPSLKTEVQSVYPAITDEQRRNQTSSKGFRKTLKSAQRRDGEKKAGHVTERQELSIMGSRNEEMVMCVRLGEVMFCNVRLGLCFF